MRVALEVYYRKSESVGLADWDTPFGVELARTHTLVHGEVVECPEDLEGRHQFLDELFRRFNNFNTNPLLSPRAQSFLRRNRIHTSMTMGDVVRLARAPDFHELWYCAAVGFETVQELVVDMLQ